MPTKPAGGFPEKLVTFSYFPLAILMVLIVAVWKHTLRDYFLGDDFAYSSLYSSFPIWRWPTLFVTEWSQGIWGYRLIELRPFAALSYILDFQLWGANPLGYHITNLGIHILNTLLVVAIARHWTQGGLAALLAGVIFGLHPVHAEAVTWITGRVDVIATFFYLFGLWSFARFRTTGRPSFGLLVVVSYFAGTFSKEFCLTLPLMLGAFDLCCFHKETRWSWQALWPYAGCAAVAVIYAACRVYALGDSSGASASLFAPGWMDALAQRHVQYLAWLAEVPKSILLQAMPYAGTVISAVLSVVVVVSSLGWYLAKRFGGLRQVRPLLFFFVAWYLVATCPLIVTYISKRHLYLASAGACIGVALLCDSFLKDRRMLGAIVIVACVSHFFWMHEALRFWHEAAQRSWKAHVALGEALAKPSSTPSSLLLVEIPEGHRGAWVWSWAYPYSAQPPFWPKPIAGHDRVLTRPALYTQAQIWSKLPLVKELRQQTGPVRLLVMNAAGETTLSSIPAEKVAEASVVFSDTNLTPDKQWLNFISSLQP